MRPKKVKATTVTVLKVNKEISCYFNELGNIISRREGQVGGVWREEKMGQGTQ